MLKFVSQHCDLRTGPHTRFPFAFCAANEGALLRSSDDVQELRGVESETPLHDMYGGDHYRDDPASDPLAFSGSQRFGGNDDEFLIDKDELTYAANPRYRSRWSL